jgi:hypothetical protein
MQATGEWWEDFFRGPWGELQALGYPEERTAAEAEFLVTALALEPGNACSISPAESGGIASSSRNAAWL